MSRLQLVHSLADLPATAWDALHDGCHPFVRHDFLAGLETHGCLRAEWGWTPRHAALFDGGQLVAAAPAYLKGNSHGEFVFDHAWARAFDQLGRDYYPKWLVAVPYSPVTGPRLLARDPATRRELVEALRAQAQADGLSSA
ncbi:MAG: peptidogalycan biosysnthesis protein, partial [Luteimonas sp.]